MKIVSLVSRTIWTRDVIRRVFSRPVPVWIDHIGPAGRSAWVISNCRHPIWVISSIESLYLLLITSFIIKEHLQTMLINAHGRTWKVADPILLAGSRRYRKLFSWRSFSHMTETLMSKIIRYFFWYILGAKVWAGSRRKILENARNLKAGIQWRIIWLDFSSARKCQELGRAGSQVLSADSRFKVPRNFRWVPTENSFSPTNPSPWKSLEYFNLLQYWGSHLGLLPYSGLISYSLK